MTARWETRRRELGVSLDELSAALGPRFSRARLSTAGRGLSPLSGREEQALLNAVERIGALRSEVRDVITRAQRLDLGAFCKDIRAQVAA